MTGLCIWLSLVLLLNRLLLARSIRLEPVYWNSSNPLFLSGYRISARLRDRVDIVCPYYDGNGTQTDMMEHAAIYSVPRHNFADCTRPATAQLVGTCSQPRSPHLFTVVLRRFTPKPGGIEFQPGRTYYFISTSDGSIEGLDNKEGGFCISDNMKLQLRVEAATANKVVNEYGTWVIPDSKAEAEKNLVQPTYELPVTQPAIQSPHVLPAADPRPTVVLLGDTDGEALQAESETLYNYAHAAYIVSERYNTAALSHTSLPVFILSLVLLCVLHNQLLLSTSFT